MDFSCCFIGKNWVGHLRTPKAQRSRSPQLLSSVPGHWHLSGHQTLGQEHLRASSAPLWAAHPQAHRHAHTVHSEVQGGWLPVRKVEPQSVSEVASEDQKKTVGFIWDSETDCKVSKLAGRQEGGDALVRKRTSLPHSKGRMCPVSKEIA